MNKAFGNSDPGLEAYTHRTFAPEDPFLADVRARSTAAGLPDIHVAPLDGLHLEVLARLSGARRAVEIGTLGGYSGTCLLRGMPADAVLDTCELDPRHADVARETFRRAGFEGRARVHLGPALESLARLAPAGPFDLVFVDADKVSYGAYAEWAADHLRVGGLALFDNAFLFGRVVEDPDQAGAFAPSIRGMRHAHDVLARAGRFRATLLPTGEGLAVGVKVR